MYQILIIVIVIIVVVVSIVKVTNNIHSVNNNNNSSYIGSTLGQKLDSTLGQYLKVFPVLYILAR